jgi:hypothetical protein
MQAKDNTSHFHTFFLRDISLYGSPCHERPMEKKKNLNMIFLIFVDVNQPCKNSEDRLIAKRKFTSC